MLPFCCLLLVVWPVKFRYEIIVEDKNLPSNKRGSFLKKLSRFSIKNEGGFVVKKQRWFQIITLILCLVLLVIVI